MRALPLPQQTGHSVGSVGSVEPVAEAQVDSPRLRLAALVNSHHVFVWRTLRRLGVAEADADDATQDVFLAAARKLEGVAPGAEAAYLFGIVERTAANRRRARARARESAEARVGGRAATAPSAEQLLDQKRCRELLEEILDGMPTRLRTVFVLYELDDFDVPEIARLLGIPAGTVASRIRRARQLFRQAIQRYQARTAPRGGTP